MRTFVSIIFLDLMLHISCNAQLYDAQWKVGDYYTVILDFRTNDTIEQRLSTYNMPSTFTNANICDETGNLLYCTSGIYIADQNGDTIQNGTGLSPCPYTEAYSGSGLNIPQAALFLPAPGNSRYYYLFHYSCDTANDERPGTMYYSLIDKTGNFGAGLVIRKNVPILQHVILRGGGMTACKHANGRDYWIIMGGSENNLFYKFLLKSDTILGPYLQNIGPDYLGPLDIAYSCFSSAGDKYATGAYGGPITIMDFDRCEGEFSNAQVVDNFSAGFSGAGITSLAFSPNGRFLYIANRVDLKQYDLFSHDIQDSVVLYYADSTDHAQIDMLGLASNGKIYGSAWNGGYYFMHVINQPDLLGDSCQFVYGGLNTLCANPVNLPNMINYKLGPLIGSGCDTVSSITDIRAKNQEPRIIPNPADKYVYVEMGVQGNYEFELLNEPGQVIATKQTKQVDIFDTEKLITGVYFLRVIDKNTNAEIGVRKVVVEH
jgi:hypothetical protein